MINPGDVPEGPVLRLRFWGQGHRFDLCKGTKMSHAMSPKTNGKKISRPLQAHALSQAQQSEVEAAVFSALL